MVYTNKHELQGDFRRVLGKFLHNKPKIDEFLSPKHFDPVPASTYPEDYTNDILLALGIHYVLRDRDMPNSFYVIEGGKPHIPAICCILRYNGIEPYLWVEKTMPENYWSNYKYFGARFSKLKKGRKLARVFDTHSKVKRDKHMPGKDFLKSMGIENILVILEGNVIGLNNEYNLEWEQDKLFQKQRKSLEKFVDSYKKNFNIKIYEGDPRPRDEIYKIIKMLEEDENLINFLIKIWGRKGKLENKEDVFDKLS